MDLSFHLKKRKEKRSRFLALKILNVGLDCAGNAAVIGERKERKGRTSWD